MDKNYMQELSEFALLRQDISDIKNEQSKQNERLARIEEKLDNNAGRCFDRGRWMVTVENRLEQSEDALVGVKTLGKFAAALLSVLAVVGAWVNK